MGGWVGHPNFKKRTWCAAFLLSFLFVCKFLRGGGIIWGFFEVEKKISNIILQRRGKKIDLEIQSPLVTV